MGIPAGDEIDRSVMQSGLGLGKLRCRNEPNQDHAVFVKLCLGWVRRAFVSFAALRTVLRVLLVVLKVAGALAGPLLRPLDRQADDGECIEK